MTETYPPLPPGRSDRLTALFEQLPHIRHLGIRILELHCGRALMYLDYRGQLVGNPQTGVLHGGVVTTLLDSAAGAAVATRLSEARALATLDLRIDYLKPVRPCARLFGQAEVYSLTASVAFVRGHVYQGEPTNNVATAVATFMMGSVGFVAIS